MTLATDIATYGAYNSGNITNMLAQAFDLLSLHYGSTLVENTDEDWDRIAKYFTLHLLDRKRLSEKAMTDSSIHVPMLYTKEILEMIAELKLKADTSTAPENSIIAIVSTPAENWYDPVYVRGSQI